jgi:hypothetical protein
MNQTSCVIVLRMIQILPDSKKPEVCFTIVKELFISYDLMFFPIGFTLQEFYIVIFYKSHCFSFVYLTLMFGIVGVGSKNLGPQRLKQNEVLNVKKFTQLM